MPCRQMNMRLGLVVLMTTYAGGIFAQQVSCAALSLPALIACVGEGCGLAYDKAITDIVLLAKPEPGAQTVATLERCQTLPDSKPMELITQLGLARVARVDFSSAGVEESAELSLVSGDFVALVQDEGEGFYEVCAGDIRFEAVDSSMPGGIVFIDVLKPAQSQSWIRFQLDETSYGYVRASNPGLMRAYAFDQTRVCP